MPVATNTADVDVASRTDGAVRYFTPLFTPSLVSITLEIMLRCDVDKNTTLLRKTEV